MFNGGIIIMGYNPYDHFDITPQQYHAGLNKLWAALGIVTVQNTDVFTLCAREITDLKTKIAKAKRDTELLDLLETKAKQGWCPCLLYDDNGHWAVAGDGTQNVPMDDAPCDIQTTFWVEAHQWKNSVREALEEFASWSLESEEDYDN
jgi:hypothetical protein